MLLCEKKKDLACLDAEMKMLEEELSKKIDEKLEMCADIKKLDKQVHRAFADAGSFESARPEWESARPGVAPSENFSIIELLPSSTAAMSWMPM